MSIAHLQPIVGRLGKLLLSHEDIIKEAKAAFCDYPSTESFVTIIPELEMMYAKEFFDESGFQSYVDYLTLKGRQLSTKQHANEIKIRNAYVKDRHHLRKQLTNFKCQLHLILYNCSLTVGKATSAKRLEKCVSSEDFANTDGNNRDESKSKHVEDNRFDSSGKNKNKQSQGERKRRGDFSSSTKPLNESCRSMRSRLTVDNPQPQHIQGGNAWNDDIDSHHASALVSAVETTSSMHNDSAAKNLPVLLNNSSKLASVVEPHTKQASKRNRKKTIKKLLKSILQFQTLTNQQKYFHLAYVNEKFNVIDAASIRKWFENEGFVALSMVANLRSLTQIEKDVVGVFNDIEKQFTHTLSTQNNRRLINQPSGGKYSVIYMTEDDKRRAVSISFSKRTRSLQIMVNYYVQQFINLGLVPPGTKIFNAKGESGLELLYKGTGLKNQIAHYDYQQSKTSKTYLSYTHSIEHNLPFDSKLDGGCSFFLNHKDADETLGTPEGKIIVVPAFSFCLLRGNIAHYGTGNSTDLPVFKFFGFLDPPEFNRVHSIHKDVVFLHDEYKQYVRSAVPPYEVKLQTSILPYYCTYCRETNYYTYPFCKACLLDKWHIAVTWTESKNYSYTFVGTRSLPSRYTFPDPFKYGCVKYSRFWEDYGVLKCSNVGYIPLNTTHCLSILEYKCILATMRKSITCFNVHVYFDGKVAWLQTTKQIAPQTELVLNSAECMATELLVVDIDEYAIRELFEENIGDTDNKASGNSFDETAANIVDGMTTDEDMICCEDDEEYESCPGSD